MITRYLQATFGLAMAFVVLACDQPQPHTGDTGHSTSSDAPNADVGNSYQDNLRKYAAPPRDSLPTIAFDVESLEARGISHRLNLRLVQLDALLRPEAFQPGWSLSQHDWRAAVIPPQGVDTLALHLLELEAAIKPEYKTPAFLNQRRQWLSRLQDASTLDGVRVLMMELEAGLKTPAYRAERFKHLHQRATWQVQIQKPIENAHPPEQNAAE